MKPPELTELDEAIATMESRQNCPEQAWWPDEQSAAVLEAARELAAIKRGMGVDKAEALAKLNKADAGPEGITGQHRREVRDYALLSWIEEHKDWARSALQAVDSKPDADMQAAYTAVWNYSQMTALASLDPVKQEATIKAFYAALPTVFRALLTTRPAQQAGNDANSQMPDYINAAWWQSWQPASKETGNYVRIAVAPKSEAEPDGWREATSVPVNTTVITYGQSGMRFMRKDEVGQWRSMMGHPKQAPTHWRQTPAIPTDGEKA
jgi:hypothetical protein